MTQTLVTLMAQINPTVGAIKDNTALIKDIITNHQIHHDLIIFPELALTGYPPEDLLLRPSFYEACRHALEEIAEVITDCHVIIGHPSAENNKKFNSASVYYQKNRLAMYHKQILPNYGVFDEARYFTPGKAQPCMMNIKGYNVAVCICEDVWTGTPIEQMLQNKTDILVSINASPFEIEKYQKREQIMRAHALLGLSTLYVNLVGGQDELVFDGQSFAIDSKGYVSARAQAFKSELLSVSISNQSVEGQLTPLLDKRALLYEALVCGLRDYVEKNHFPGVILGLSGGIDSALALAIAVDALGKSRVQALMMPSRFTAEISQIDAQQQLETLGVIAHQLSIEPAFKTLLQTMAPFFPDEPFGVAEENIQARIRALLLMAFSNKNGYLVLSTSNKSETAVGYTTLYGDMAGGFSVLKDVLKTQVYELANYRNSQSPIIPERVLNRPPTAELAANQKDSDSLPDYPTLDAIISLHLEQNLDDKALILKGFNKNIVNQVLRLIKRSQYKRYQSAPGVKISARALGKDWRFPITSGE